MSVTLFGELDCGSVTLVVLLLETFLPTTLKVGLVEGFKLCYSYSILSLRDLMLEWSPARGDKLAVVCGFYGKILSLT